MKVLVAVDGSHATQDAVDFVAETFARSANRSVSIVLFHVVESLPDDLLTWAASSERDAAHQKVCADLAADRKAAGERPLADRRQTLIDAGIAEADVERKLIVRESRPGAGKVVAALSIIEEMRAGGYDVVCLGRRGASGAEGSFLGSVAEKVLREARGRTVWVVDKSK